MKRTGDVMNRTGALAARGQTCTCAYRHPVLAGAGVHSMDTAVAPLLARLREGLSTRWTRMSLACLVHRVDTGVRVVRSGWRGGGRVGPGAR